jgi:hypothetical protein
MWLIASTFSVLLLLSGCSKYLDMVQPANDEAIKTDIQSKLFADSSLKQRDIRVDSEKSVVTLTGTVQSDLEKAAAENFAAQSKGVTKVVNQLIIGPATMAAAPQATEPAPEPAPVAPPKPTRHAARARHAPPASEPAAAEAVEPVPAAPAPVARAAAENAPAAALTPAAPPKPPEPERITIPAGAIVTVRMIDGIDSSSHRPGEEFAATLDTPVVVGDRVVIRRGADARVRLIESRSAGRMTGRSELTVELVGLAAGAQTYAVESSAVQKQGASRGTRTAETVGGGAVLGGLIGAIAGHGKGAAIGAAVGAGAGTAVQGATKGQQIQIPAETKLEFTLKSPLTVTL